MESFRDVIAQWPSAAALARDLGFDEKVGGLKVRAWRRRNSIPPEHWRAIERAAARREIGVTVGLLASIAAHESGRRHPHESRAA